MPLDLVMSETEYLQRVNGHAAPFIYMYDEVTCRVESTPVALTIVSIDGSGQGIFNLHIPKVPQYILKALYLFFERVADAYETEVRVRVFYNSQTGEYEINLPEQEVTSASVYTLDSEYALVTETFWPVLDMHSHCRFPAVFSGTDNRNELGNWVFGVIGSFGRRPHLMLRVGTGGNFMELHADEVFDLDACNDGLAEEIAEDLFTQASDKLWVMD